MSKVSKVSKVSTDNISNPTHRTYRSLLSFQREHANAIAIFCSDGRFADDCDAFIKNALKVSRFDRFVVPGGPACLVLNAFTLRDYDVARERISFLVEAHRINRAVLISHEDCGFYKVRFPSLSEEARREQQLEELKFAKQTLKAWFAAMQVDSYYAYIGSDGKVSFEGVE